MIKLIDLLCNESNGSYHFHKHEDGQYEITDNNANIGATIDPEDGEIVYYVVGVYNSGCDWAEIDIEALNGIKKLCETLRDNMMEGD